MKLFLGDLFFLLYFDDLSSLVSSTMWTDMVGKQGFMTLRTKRDVRGT